MHDIAPLKSIIMKLVSTERLSIRGFYSHVFTSLNKKNKKYLEAIIYTEVHEFCDSKGLKITLLAFEDVGAQKYRQRKKKLDNLVFACYPSPLPSHLDSTLTSYRT